MTVGVHPAVTFDKSLAVGQEVEVRFETEGRLIRLRARITKLNEHTAHVESLEDSGRGWPASRGLEIPRFSSPLWSRNEGLFPAVQS